MIEVLSLMRIKINYKKRENDSAIMAAVFIG